MLAILLLLVLAQSQGNQMAVTDRVPLINQKLPFSPFANSQMVVTGGGDGLGLDVVPAIDRAFDPNKEIPAFDLSTGHGPKTILKPTPKDYTATDEVMFRILEMRNGEPLFHDLQAVHYRDRNMDDRETVLFFDHKTFAIYNNSPGDDEGPGENTNANLIQEPDGHVELDIGQYMSGTGAINSHAIFDLTTTGPVLSKITEGGRGR
jgi:hypothetical protein